MSKLIEVKFSVDTENPQEVQNLIEVLQGFIGEKTEPVKKEVPKKAAPKKETPAKKEAPKKEAPAKEEAPKEAAKEESTSDVKIEDVRALLAKKVNDHRTEIKAKLTELGANNVTSLDKAKYPEFTEFLNSL